MPSDLLTLSISEFGEPQDGRPQVDIRPVSPDDAELLAALYRASYPPEIGAADADEARAEIHRTFAGEYGLVRTDASLLGSSEGRPGGAVLVVERSIWDSEVDGPVVIDLFVAPEFRGRGLGLALMRAAISACRANRDRTLTVRVGEGTSETAHRLYAGLGFIPLETG